ncbi:hypothetical protein [Novosphingobium olei]|uniref:hypothetical protein n=1 Tax=Novosphingobium olei TaxID=2728851 RepID=UPI00309259A4|nr:fibronectin type III domain-containing protein [Novosphingobium olei]
MGKVLGSIIQTIAGIALVVTGNPAGIALIANGVSNFVSAVLSSPPKPDTAETSVKKPRPERVSAYGRMRLWGASILYETADPATGAPWASSGSNGTAVDVYAVHDGKMSALVQRYLNDDAITVSGSAVSAGTDGRYGGGKVNFYSTDGSTPGTPISAIGSLLGPTVWTSNHRGDGVVLMALTCAPVKAEDFQDVYPQSTPPTPSIVADWQACPDPAGASPLDESTWTATENPVRHLLHYMMVREGPRPALPKSDAGYAAELLALRTEWWNRKIAPTLSFWIAAAAVCNEARTLKAGGTEAKYRACLAHKHTDAHERVKAALLSTFDGWMAPRADGAIVIYAGKFIAPAVSIGPEEIVSYTWNGGAVDDDQAVNELVCSYVSADHDYNTVECDPWRDEADIAERGQVLSQTLESQCPSHAQARFLAKRKMARINAPNRGTVTTNIAGRVARGERFVNLRIEEAGAVFFDGVAEITALSRSLSGGVTFEWVEADPNIDNWNPTTEEGDPAAKGNRIAPSPLETPTIASASATTVSGLKYLDLDVDAPDRTDLTWYAHWRINGASVWGADASYSDTDPGTPVSLQVGPVPSGETIEVEVAYRVGDGRLSPWSASATVTVT